MIEYREPYRQELVMIARGMRMNPTEAERVLWSRLKGRRLGVKFRRQHPIGRFVVDFCCLQSRLVIEVDGSIHKDRTDYDWERNQHLQQLGYRVMRFSNIQVLLQTDRVIGHVDSMIAHPSRPNIYKYYS
ncbi:endonuclease domain-containing protein [Candidatus Uhrbacteria bacterium]|nr:endonuclease domain-containing protein [Candidatus Uhrbacteria bacterium]